MGAGIRQRVEPVTEVPFAIRCATPGDLPRIQEIERASFTVPWSPETLRSVLVRADTDFLVATWLEEVVAYAILWTPAGESELANIAVADAFDCITHTRSYREARSPERALDLITGDAGFHFDPTVAEALAMLVHEGVLAPEVQLAVV